MSKEYLSIRNRQNYCLIPASWNVLALTKVERKGIAIPPLQEYIQYYIPGGGITALYEKNDWEKFGEKLSESILRDYEMFEKLYSLQRDLGMELEKYCRSILDEPLPDGKVALFTIYENIRRLEVDYNSINLPLWFIAGEIFIKKVHSSLNEIGDESWGELIIPWKKSITLSEEEDCLKSVLSTGNIEAAAKKLSDKYGWLPCHYDAEEYWDSKYYQDKIIQLRGKSDEKNRERLKFIQEYERERQKIFQEICRHYQLSEQMQKNIRIIHSFAIAQDERKKFTFFAHYIWRKVAEKLAVTLRIPFISLKYCSLEEIKKLDTDRIIHLSEERSRNPLLLLDYDHVNHMVLLCGQEATTRFNQLYAFETETPTLRGLVANKGGKKRIEGKARILMSSKESDKLKESEILVAPMTSPDYIAAIRKSSAIVTDEGGINCHAALLSRELNIPCITGTKDSTRLLKDGNIVQLDLKSGIITII